MTLSEINRLNTNEKTIQINKYKEIVEKLSNIIAPLKVPYNDLSILLQSSPELEFVDKFFSDITCKDKGIENLLYEVIGYCFVRTAKLNKSIILRGLRT